MACMWGCKMNILKILFIVRYLYILRKWYTIVFYIIQFIVRVLGIWYNGIIVIVLVKCVVIMWTCMT